MSLADELLADLEDENDDEELQELIKDNVNSDGEGKKRRNSMNFVTFYDFISKTF